MFFISRIIISMLICCSIIFSGQLTIKNDLCIDYNMDQKNFDTVFKTIELQNQFFGFMAPVVYKDEVYIIGGTKGSFYDIKYNVIKGTFNEDGSISWQTLNSSFPHNINGTIVGYPVVWDPTGDDERIWVLVKIPNQAKGILYYTRNGVDWVQHAYAPLGGSPDIERTNLVVHNNMLCLFLANEFHNTNDGYSWYGYSGTDSIYTTGSRSEAFSLNGKLWILNGSSFSNDVAWYSDDNGLSWKTVNGVYPYFSIMAGSITGDIGSGEELFIDLTISKTTADIFTTTDFEKFDQRLPLTGPNWLAYIRGEITREQGSHRMFFHNHKLYYLTEEKCIVIYKKLNVSGRILNRGATINVNLTGNNLNLTTTTNTAGEYNFSVPTGKYTIKPVISIPSCPSEITVTVIKDTIVPDMALGSINFYFSPKTTSNGIQVGQTISFLPITGSDQCINSYKWEFGDGSIVFEKNPVHVYLTGTVSGKTEVKMTAYFNDGKSMSITKNIPLDCGPPGDPLANYIVDPAFTFIREDIDNDGNTIWEIEDKCPLGTETVTFLDASVPYKCGTTATINAREWKLNNVVKGAATSASVQLSSTTDNVLSLNVKDINGKTNTVTRKIQLVPCKPGMNSADFTISNAGNIIQGEIFLDMLNKIGLQGTGIKTFQLKEDVPLRCECLINSVTYTWKIRYLNSNYDYNVITGQGPIDFTSTMGFGIYEITLEVVINNTIKSTVTKKLNITFPLPYVACPPYGCKSVSNSCNSLFDIIDGAPIDKAVHLTNATGTLSLKAIGNGFAQKPAMLPDGTIDNCAFWDEGSMRSVVASGDFSITARISNLSTLNQSVQAGLMVRPGYLSYDKMLFVGTKGHKDIVLHRKRVRQDAYSYIRSDRNDNWFRITRINGIYATYGSVDGTTWVSLDPALHTLSGLEGTVVIGLAAAGKPSIPYATANFDMITVSVPDMKLSIPNDIINTVFADGNYVSNWGFENNKNVFNVIGNGLFNNRFTSTGNIVAYEGHYCGRATNKTSSWLIESDKYAINPYKNSKKITALLVDFYAKPIASSVQNAPVINWYGDNGFISKTTLDTKTYAADTWNHIQQTIAIPSDSSITFFSFMPLSQSLDIAFMDIDNILISTITGVESNKPVTTITYADGLSQKFQTVQNAGDSDIVASVILDDNGKTERVLPLFVTRSNLHSIKSDPDSDMENYLKPANVGWEVKSLQSNFGTTIYEKSPLGKPVQVLGRKNYMDTRYLYTNDSSPEVSPHKIITETQSGFDIYKTGYQIKRDYTDAYGHVVRNEISYKDTSSNPQILISTREPDILDRTWKQVSPMGQNYNQADPNSKKPAMYRYSTTNEILETENTDAGKTISLYDKLGKVRFFQDGNQKVKKQFIAYRYDAFSRLKTVYLVQDSDGSKWNQINADNPYWPIDINEYEKWAEIVIQCEYDYAPQELPSEINDDDFSNTQGRMTYQASMTSKGKISEYYSYDSQGRIKNKWKKILNLPVQKISMEYNATGQAIEKTIEGIEPAKKSQYLKKEAYVYDHLNRLSKILHLDGSDMKQLAMYEYWPDGKIRNEYLGNATSVRNRFIYDFAERVNKKYMEKLNNDVWSIDNTFRQILTYDLRNNIKRQSSYVSDLPQTNRNFIYQYDQFNRLILAQFYASNGTPATVDMEFASAAEYDDDGSITRLAQGTRINDFPTTGGQYYYYPNSHRLEKITGLIFENGKDRSQQGNYQYDENGNIIMDKANKRKINYDYRNLPASVVEFSDTAMTMVKNFTEYYYDASGNRVLKTQVK